MTKSIQYDALALSPRPTKNSRFTWLSSELRRLIADGVLVSGSRLPSSRCLASAYGLARGTVVQVYEQLQLEGYLIGAKGSGTRVAQENPRAMFTERMGAGRSKREGSRGQRAGSIYGADAAHKGTLFAPHLIALDKFPVETWTRIAARCLRSAPARLFGPGDAAGYKPLRSAVAHYLRTARGVRCGDHQVVIGSGTQFTLAVISRLLLRGEDQVWMEEPGYAGAKGAFRQAGATLCPIPVDRHGLLITQGRQRYPTARLAYVTPAHQWPLGGTLPYSRRAELLSWAQTTKAYIFEDDYDSEFRFHGHPLPALQGLAGGERVIFAGSFNKTLFPSIRLGYAVLPEELIESFLAARVLIERYPPGLEQAILTDFIETGEFGRHVRRMRLLYAERRESLLSAFARELAGLMTIADIPAGLQTPAWFKTAANESAITAQACQRGMQLVPLSSFYERKPARTGFLLGFAASTPSLIAKGCQDLAEIVRRSG